MILKALGGMLGGWCIAFGLCVAACGLAMSDWYVTGAALAVVALVVFLLRARPSRPPRA